MEMPSLKCQLFVSQPPYWVVMEGNTDVFFLTIASLCPARFLTAVPRVLADIYHSLGTQLPEALVAVLPADFFSDESVAKDSVSPSASSPPLSTHSLVSDGKDRLQDLRNRSAKKRRWGRGGSDCWLKRHSFKALA